MPRTSHRNRISRETQRADVIYVCPDGSAFVTPDGEGRYWYYRDFPREYEWENPNVPDGLSDQEASIWVAEQQHGDDLPIVFLEENPDD